MLEEYRSSHGRDMKKWSDDEWDEFNTIRDQIAIAEAEAGFATKRMENISKVTRMQTFDNFEIRSSWQGAIFDQAKSYADYPDGWFYAGGQSGCGKTHLCMAICRKIGDSGDLVKFSNWKEDSRILRSFSTETAKDRENLLFGMKAAKTLFIDDFLKGNATEAERSICYEIIDHRYRLNLRTIISSEYTLQRLMELFDEAIGGRIAEMCGSNVITIGSDSAKNYRAG